jgi:uncharacterized protein involved in type VI secretion and phage assembly
MAVPATTIQSPKVLVGTSALDQFWANKLTALSLEMQFQVPTRLTMRFETDVLGEQVPAFPFALDGKVTVSFPMGLTPNGSPSFSKACGVLHVTEIGVERDGSDSGEFVVVAHDASFRLTRRHNVATFADMAVSAIAEKIATTGTGISAGTVDATSGQVKYVLQADTDFGFISTLARRVGYDWWVDDDSFHFAKRPTSPTKVDVGVVKDLISFSVSQHALPSKKVTVRGWDRDQQQLVTGESTPAATSSNQIPGMSGALNGVAKSTEYTTGGIRAESAAEAASLAKAIGERYRSSAVEAHGEVVGNPAIRPGVVVSVTGQHLAGDYEVTRVEHRYARRGYTTRFTAGDRVPSGLADIIGGASSADHFGAYTGLPALIPAKVTTIGTGEFLGRVKVTFPYLSEENSSHWARVLSAGGGPERGFWFLPEVGDEVLVAFEGGDTRFPVVMGGLYGKVNTPEAQLIKDGKINSRSVRSRLGHYMDFVDGTDDATRHIAFGLGANGKPGDQYKVRLGEDRFDIEVPEGKPISIKAGAAQITFTNDKSIEIAAENITIKATTNLDLEGKSVTIKGTQELTISQGGNKVAMASGGLDVKGAPQTNIKGAPKVNIG